MSRSLVMVLVHGHRKTLIFDIHPEWWMSHPSCIPLLGKCHPLQATKQVTSYYGQITRKSALPKVGMNHFGLYLFLCLASSSFSSSSAEATVWWTVGQISSIFRRAEVLIQSTICHSLVYKMKVSVSWYFLSHSTVRPFIVHASESAEW